MRLLDGLFRTRQKLASIPISEDWRSAWNNRLIAVDIGVRMAQKIVDEVAAESESESQNKSQSKLQTVAPSAATFKKVIARRLQRAEAMIATSSHRPYVILTVGVNGSGKTTTIGKLAYYYTQQNKKVLLAAGDTFRAAAREQLQRWAHASGQLDIVGGAQDAAAVAFDAVARAQQQEFDIVIVDTAGRLPTQKPLIDELRKICRTLTKAEATAPHELLLILDATTGQNALAQIGAFADATGGITGAIVTKLDGTSKGGFLLAMAEQYQIPIRFVGVGEGKDDLILFDATQYADALIGEDA